MSLPGVDLSVFQRVPRDWTRAAGSIDWAAVKVSELLPGGKEYVNPDAGDDWAQLHVDHKGRLGYLFGHPKTDVDRTVDLFLSELDKLGLEDEDGVVIDHETDDGDPQTGKGAVPAAECAAWANEVAVQLDRHLQREPLLYTYRDFAETGHCAGLGHLKLWISDPDGAAGKPHVPGPWTTWAIHQYVTTGDIDRDVANFSGLAAFRAAVGKRTAPGTGDEPMKFISTLALDGEQEIPVGKAIVPLKWRAVKGKAHLLAKGSSTGLAIGAQTVFSVGQLRMTAGTKVRYVLTGYDAKGKQLGQLARDYDYIGGWVDVVLPLEAEAGARYELAVINMGTAPLQFSNGSWLVIA